MLIHKRDEILELWILKEKRSNRVKEIETLARKQHLQIIFKTSLELEKHLPKVIHQGVALVVKQFAYSSLEELIRISRNKRPSLLIMADHITDQGNLGAIIRTACFFKAQGLIIPKDRTASVTANVFKRSSGAHFSLPIARVVNLGRSLDNLKKEGYWTIGASGNGTQSIYSFDWNRDLVLILGNEHKGLGANLEKKCHQVVQIPSPGKVESLNVSVAAGVILSEITRQRQLF